MGLTLPGFMSAAFGRGCEASILEIATLFEVPLTEHPFEISLTVEGRLKEFGLIMVPALPKGSPESRRLICSPTRQNSANEVIAEIQLGEGATIEFKSTFMYHVDRARAGTYTDVRELKSEDVMHASLKTVAALMNSSGGALFIGVDDQGNVHGIESDFELLPADSRNVDGWELEFRQQLQARFHDGMTVNNFVRVGFVEHEGLTIARVEVTPRQRCSYLKNKKSNAFDVYVRQGNRSVSLSLPEFEEFLTARR